MSTNDEAFYPYSFPLPNMLVQAEKGVSIHGLESEAGRALNGKRGTAKEFHPHTGRWSVEVDNEVVDGSNNNNSTTKKKLVKIQIKNLKRYFSDDEEELRFCMVPRENPGWMEGSDQGRVLVVAGTMGGHPALCVYDDFSRPGFDREAFVEAVSQMGLSRTDGEQFLATSAGLMGGAH